MLMVIQTGTTSMTVKLNTLMAVPKTSLLTMMTELYTFRESKLKANTSLSTKKVRCRMAYSTARTAILRPAGREESTPIAAFIESGLAL